jgi:aurora kinase
MESLKQHESESNALVNSISSTISSNRTTSSIDTIQLLQLTRTELSNMERNRLRMGSRKNDYIFYKIIGKGSYGTVWKAKSNHTKQIVAIKILDKDAIKKSGIIHHVRSEVIIHLKMKHENIVELYHFFEDSSSIYMVMEYCKYNMLYYLQKKGFFSERRCRKFMMDIVSGVMHLHSNQILHRDLKLANLLLTQDKRVKISDFGLSRYALSNEECETQLGTPKYMAYEVVLQKPYTQKADNWSLGCIIYALLAGKTPFHRESETVEETFRLIQNMDYHLPEHFSVEAKDLISKLLTPDPSRRLSLKEVLSHDFFKTNPQIECRSPTPAVIRDDRNNSQTREALVLSTSNSKIEETRKLCTKYLKPISLTIDSGKTIIEIDEKKQLRIHSGPIDFIVSSNGEHIWYKDSDAGAGYSIYSFSKLPANLVTYYNYACAIVDVMKSKTPRFIYNSENGRCMLMSNEPKADVEMIFYSSSIRLVYLRNKDIINVYERDQVFPSSICLMDDLLTLKEDSIYCLQACSVEMKACIVEFKRAIEQCLALVSQLTPQE